MAISYPAHWKEPFYDKGPKYDKIKEIIDQLNTLEPTDSVTFAGLSIVNTLTTGTSALQIVTGSGRSFRVYNNRFMEIGDYITIGTSGQLNFAGGTTYRVEIDGDAVFKYITLNNDVLTNFDKLSDIGATGVAWDDVYADDFVNESSWEDFADPLSEINKITSELLESGEKRMKHITAPAWTRTRDKVRATRTVQKEICGIDGKPTGEFREEEEEYWDHTRKETSTSNYSINRMQCVIIQTLQQIKTRLDLLEGR